MDYAVDRSQGSREYQQDDFGVIEGASRGAGGESLTVFVIADGMGGHEAGERASAAAVHGFVTAFEQTSGPVVDRLREALLEANARIGRLIAEEPELDGTGTTLLAVAMADTSVEWVSVGDSKLRLWRGRDGALRRLNADHSMTPVIESMADGADEAMAGQRNALRSALVGGDIALLDASSQPCGLEPGDLVLLASDGLDTLSDAEIESLLNRHGRDAETAVRRLLEAVRDKGVEDQDNVTALVARAPGVPAALAPSRGGLRWWLGMAATLLVTALLAYLVGASSGEAPAAAPDSSAGPALDSLRTEPSDPGGDAGPDVPAQEAEHGATTEPNDDD